MHLKVSLLLSFFCLLLTGCSFTPNKLKNAELILDAHSDSVLSILQHIKPESIRSNSNRALYGLLLFRSLDKKGIELPPDSIITFSIEYYQNSNDKPHLAKSLYYKALLNKRAQKFDVATLFYLKALDLAKKNKDYLLVGNIYSDLGDISTIQKDYNESLIKFRESVNSFNAAGNKIEARYRLISIGKIYHFLNRYNEAQFYYKLALLPLNDSILQGSVYQSLGENYYWEKRMDSAQYFLQKSLQFPYKGTNYAIRCLNLADLYFDLQQTDSAFKFATIALKYPTTFYNQRDCYRILTNIEYTRKHFDKLKVYIAYYQDYTDSIHKLELQTKSSVLENLHSTTQEADGTKKNMIFIVSVLLIVLILSISLVVFLFKRNQQKRVQLSAYRQQLYIKQEFASQGLTNKIEEIKALQAEERKNASVENRETLDKNLYNTALHLNNWDTFNKEMNHAFNDIIISLKLVSPTITQKEIIWSCLHLLDIPHADRMLLLDATSDSLYKLKQRLAHKLSLKSTKELDLFLRNLIEIKD